VQHEQWKKEREAGWQPVTNENVCECLLSQSLITKRGQSNCAKAALNFLPPLCGGWGWYPIWQCFIGPPRVFTPNNKLFSHFYTDRCSFRVTDRLTDDRIIDYNSPHLMHLIQLIILPLDGIYGAVVMALQESTWCVWWMTMSASLGHYHWCSLC